VNWIIEHRTRQRRHQIGRNHPLRR
jgi:hypothetical protein